MKRQEMIQKLASRIKLDEDNCFPDSYSPINIFPFPQGLLILLLLQQFFSRSLIFQRNAAVLAFFQHNFLLQLPQLILLLILQVLISMNLKMNLMMTCYFCLILISLIFLTFYPFSFLKPVSNFMFEGKNPCIKIFKPSIKPT